jgi:hypothetical protein
VSNETIRLLKAAIEALKTQRKGSEVFAPGYYLLRDDDKEKSLGLCRASEDAKRGNPQQLDPAAKPSASARTQWIDPKPFPHLERGSHLDQIIDAMVAKYAGGPNSQK